MQRNKPTDQRVAPQPEFGQGNDAQRRFVQTNITSRDTFYGRSRTHTARANQVGARIDEKSRKFEALRTELAKLMEEKAEEERLAQANWEDYQAHEDALKLIGVTVPPPVDPQTHLLTSPQGDPQTHAAQFGFPDTAADGFCIHCGQQAWKVPVSEVNPAGARHSFGATCNPNDPASNVATLALSESEAVG